MPTCRPGRAARVCCADITRSSSSSKSGSPRSAARSRRCSLDPDTPRTSGCCRPSCRQTISIVSDARNHASLIDGIRLTKAATAIYPHQDLECARGGAAQAPERARARHHRKRVQHGWRSDAAARGLRYRRARAAPCVIVDEAHATGLYGARGSGRVEELGLRDRVARHDAHRREGAGIWRCVGGRVARAARCDGESRALVHFLDGAAAGAGRGARCRAAISFEPSRSGAREVHRKSSLLRGGASQTLVCRPAASRRSCRSSSARTRRRLALQSGLMAAGFDVRAIRPPSVAPGTARLRVTVRYPVADEDLLRFAREVADLLHLNWGLTLLSTNADDIRRWDADHVWHPFTQMREYLATEPLVVVRAEGNYLIDDRGRRLLRRHVGPVVQSARAPRARNRRGGHRAARTICAHDAARHDASRRGRAGAAARGDCAGRPESRVLLRQRRHCRRGGAEDRVPVPAAHAGQRPRPNTRCT